MIDFSHTARHAHHATPARPGSVSWSASARDLRVTLADGAIVVPAVPGRGAHRPAPVSLVKSTV